MAALTRFLVWTALFVGVIVGILRVTALRWVRLPENDPVFETSVLPTLEGGDLLILWRLGHPGYGDLVLCPEPHVPERYVVGRIVGLPGDRVRIKDGTPVVNEKPFVVERACDPHTFTFPHPDRPSEQLEQACSWEEAGSVLHMMGEPQLGKIVPEDRQYDVPEGQWFLLSDNRHFPYDSRDFGYIDIKTCNEVVLTRLVSRRGWTDAKRRITYIQ